MTSLEMLVALTWYLLHSSTCALARCSSPSMAISPSTEHMPSPESPLSLGLTMDFAAAEELVSLVVEELVQEVVVLAGGGAHIGDHWPWRWRILSMRSGCRSPHCLTLSAMGYRYREAWLQRVAQWCWGTRRHDPYCQRSCPYSNVSSSMPISFFSWI